VPPPRVTNRFRGLRALAPLLIAASLVAAAPASASPLETVPLVFLERNTQSSAPVQLTQVGIVLTVVQDQTLVLPLPGVDRLVLDLIAEGHFRLAWTNESPAGVGGTAQPPPYLVLRPGRTTVDLDLLIDAPSDPRARPVLSILGSGRLIIAAARASRITGDPAELSRRADLATLLAPQTIWPASINFLHRPLLSSQPELWFDDVVALLAALAATAAAIASWRRYGRTRALAAGLVAACLTAALLSNALMLIRFLPAFRLEPTSSPEDRIRDNYYFQPELGALAAVARSTLPPTDRVGIIGPAGDWFTAQTLCFNLAPRPCVKIEGNGPRYAGISEVERLALDELDALVVLADASPPSGFIAVAGIGPYAFVARRP
jgi:hypothetical protein